MRRIFLLFLWMLNIVYALGLLTILFSRFWPGDYWWIYNDLARIPWWTLTIPACVLAVFSTFLRSYSFWLAVISAVIVFLGIADYHLPYNPKIFPYRPEKTLRVATINMGNKAEVKALQLFIEEEKPDIIFFQEFPRRGQVAPMMMEKGYKIHVKPHTAVASRFPLLMENSVNRRSLNDWGLIALKYRIEAPMGPIWAMNVHLETPREGLEVLRWKRLEGIPEARDVVTKQVKESMMARDLFKDRKPVIIGGDFNLPVIHPIFKIYWGEFQDTYSKMGAGFGFTKFPRWHGVRIDHILCDESWEVVDCRVGPSFGGDHRPVIATIVYLGDNNS